MAKYMSKSEYLTSVKGKKIDTDGVPANQPYQCADLTKDYVKKCYGIDFTFSNSQNPNGYAKGLYENFESYPQLKDKFIKIPNTKTFVPEKGDIVEWGQYKGVTGVAGHTAVALGINDGTSYFKSLDQNWSKKYYVTEVNHNYKGVLGVIRPLLKCVTANLNVRAGAGTNYNVVDVIDKGTLVKVYETKGTWSRIGEGKWVSSNYLD